VQIQTSRIRPLRSWRKVSGYAPSTPLRREDAVVRSESQGCDLSAYSREYRLREEAHESWKYAVTEELVYIEDSFGANGDAGRNIAKDYLEGNLWMDVQFVFLGQRNGKCSVILESFKNYVSAPASGKEKVNLGTIGGNPPMLVEVTHSVQPPKKIVFHGCQTICWLKVSNNSDGISGDVRELCSKSASSVAVPLLNNRELDARVWDCDSQFRQSPHELVEARTHAVESIPASQADMVGDIIQINPEGMPLIFKVILTTKSAGIRFMENPKLSIEQFKVTLRPIQFQVGVCQSGANHNFEDSTLG